MSVIPVEGGERESGLPIERVKGERSTLSLAKATEPQGRHQL
jgi:hypothetical protein